MSKFYLHALSLIFVVTFVSTSSCTKAKNPPGLKTAMRDAYTATHELYPFVWSNGMFESKNQETKILSLLDRLLQDFHTADSLMDLPRAEPGIRTAMEANESLLKDARARFAQGEKDYAKWRLRSLFANCISCHSRYGIDVDFLGDKPIAFGSSLDERMASAEFLFATRQFDSASDSLYKIAKSLSKSPSGGSKALEALKLWLVIETRVKNRPQKAADRLRQLVKNSSFPSSQKVCPETWISDLETLSDVLPLEDTNISEVESLLKENRGNKLIARDEELLVRTLRAELCAAFRARKTSVSKRKR